MILYKPAEEYLEGECVEEMKFIEMMPKEKHLEPIIITALNTGMRKGEILNLKWSNVDFNNKVIYRGRN